MNRYKLPYTLEDVKKLDKKFGTPFLIFDEKGLREKVRSVNKAFSWVPNFKNYYAVKAHPNPYILEILKEEWCGMDCSSLWELYLSEAIWNTWPNIMFTSNDTPVEDFKKAKELNAIVNFDDITHIDFYMENVWELTEYVCCRYNPWDEKTGWNDIIWIPSEAKYGMTKEQIFQAYEKLKKLWAKKFGLHTMVMSNDLNPDSLVETARLLLELVVEVENKVGIEFDFINLWWWVGIPYHPDDKPVDLEYVSKEIKKIYDSLIDNSKRKIPLNIVMEQWRNISWPYAQLVAKVIHLKDTYKKYVWLNASMADFMRPGMYGAYHHLTVLWKENEDKNYTYDVTGSLCENNDKFAIDRKLPKIENWDYIVLHDAGAHGYAMWFNYNAKLRAKELLLKENGELIQIRRAQTLKDYFSTLDYENLNKLI